MPELSAKGARSMISGAIIGILLLVVTAISVWLASTTGSLFEITFAVVFVAIAVAVVAGYFTAGSSSIIGFATRWKQDLDVLFPLPSDEDDLLRDTRRTRNAFLAVAILGVVAIFIYALQWKPAGFAQVFGSALMMALASLAAGILFGFLFGIPRTLQEDRPAAPAPAPPRPSAGAVSTPPPPPAAHTAGLFGVNTNLEQISDWLTKIIVGLGLINLDKLPGKIRSFISQVAPSVGGQYGFALAIVGGYAICGFMLGYLLTRLYLARAFVRASARASEALGAAAGIRLMVERVGADTASNVVVGQGSSEVDPITTQEKVAAVSVERLAAKADTEHLRAEIEALAHEYESIRSAMSPGGPRTKAMEVVASKMRTLSRACYSLLPALVRSESPGQRLAAISFLEVQPNRDYLPWLAERFAVEKPFLLFHAAWALRHAANKLAVTDLDAVARAIETATATMSAHPEPDRNAFMTLRRAEADVAARRQTG